MRHDDGDEEDMEQSELEASRENFLRNVVPRHLNSFTTSPTTTSSESLEPKSSSTYVEVDTWEARSILPDFIGVVPSQSKSEISSRSRRSNPNKPLHPYDALHDRELNIDGTPLNVKSRVSSAYRILVLSLLT